MQAGLLNDICIVDVEREFTSVVKSALKAEIQPYIDDPNVKGILFNFSAVSFIDSETIGLLVRIYKLLHALNKPFGICNINNNILEVFRLSKLDKIIKLYPNEEKAIELMLPLTKNS